MSKKIITRLEDARAIKAMDAPLNTKVINRGKLPERCEKMVESVLNAATRCQNAIYAFLHNQNASTYAKLKRAHERLGREIAKIPPPNWIDTADGGKQLTNPEDAAVSAMIGPRCFTAFNYWAGIIATIESGNELDLKISSVADVWPTET